MCAELAGGRMLKFTPSIPTDLCSLRHTKTEPTPRLSYRSPSVVVPRPPQPIRTQRRPLLEPAAIRLLLVSSVMQSDSSSHFSVRITSSSSDIGKNWAPVPALWPNVEWLKVSAGLSCPDPPVHDTTGLLVRRERERERGDPLKEVRLHGVVCVCVEVGGGGRWGPSALKPSEVMSNWLRLKSAAWIC